MKTYPSVRDRTLFGLTDFCQFISRERDNDIREWNNLNSIFLRGRKVGKVPTSSADVDPADKLNDFNWDASYIYILIDNGGTPAWRRATLGAW